jgi:glycosyltransferase involved in cell wall biosynthesis
VHHGVPTVLDGVHVTYFRSPWLRRLYWAPRMGRALSDRASSFDVVHTHSVFLWPTTRGARAARRAGVPYVLAPRGMLVPELIRARSTLIKRAWILLHERRNLRQAAAIHVTSDLERRDCVRCGVRHPCFVEIPNGIDVPARSVGRADSPAIRAAIEAGPYVLFLGRINWKKGIDRLIEAMPSLGSARLVVAGNDEGELRVALEHRAAALGIAERVSFTGAVEGRDKEALLTGCLALAAPSTSESFGNVLLEAMAAGRPVVTTPGVGMADALIRHDCGLVTEGSARRLAEALATLLRDPALADRLGANGRRAAVADYSWDRIAERAEGVYTAFVEARNRRASATAA